MLCDAEHPLCRIPGFGVREDGSMMIGTADVIAPDLCPAMHQSPDHPNRGGGCLSLVTGDLMNPDICAGPFDVVIERRTLQLFEDVDRISGLDRLVARLGARGVFVSHQHYGGWRPGEPRTHYAEAWLKSRDFVLRSERKSDEYDSAPRLACLMFSTG